MYKRKSDSGEGGCACRLYGTKSKARMNGRMSQAGPQGKFTWRERRGGGGGGWRRAALQLTTTTTIATGRVREVAAPRYYTSLMTS